MPSVHAGKTTGLAPLSWPEFDGKGFADVEAGMVAFGREHFSKRTYILKKKSTNEVYS
jgi:hypothetical protein